MKNNKLTLARLRNTDFTDLYEKLLLNNSLSNTESKKLLKLAIVFLNDDNKDIVNLGYRIILFFCNKTNDYRPLYDISINKGLIPISKSIEKLFSKNYNSDSFFRMFNTSFLENYKNEEIYLSEQQKNLNEFFLEKESNSLLIVAPTSYGKSELIISILKNNNLKNTCIIVPTKALLAQTKKRIIDAEIEHMSKIITHPEMYFKDDINITAILTQERLLRLLRKNINLNFDMVFIDEAHNLLENNSRNILLASSISILEKRNKNTVFKFLTPFLIDSSNLNINYTNYILNEFRITEYMKSERLYLCDFRDSKERKLKHYDQFLNKSYPVKNKEFLNEIDLIIKEKGKKNIVYFNKPKSMEVFSIKLSNNMEKISTDKITKACKELSKYLHKEYNLIKCISHGIIYHHGSVPNYIRLYIEHLFRNEKDLKFVVTNSTLLEGVNIPAEKLFLLDNKKGRSLLSASQFKNLVGRISRFNEVFSNNNTNMTLLEPSVYVIASEYIAQNADIEKFLSSRMKVDKAIIEIPKNVLLRNVKINQENIKDKKEADEFIENFETNVINDAEVSQAKTKIGKICFGNNIKEIDILNVELLLDEKAKTFKKEYNIIDNAEDIFLAISEIFLPFIKDKNEYENLKRLKNYESQKFYTMFLNWRIESTPYNRMINSFLKYWKKFDKKEEKDKKDEVNEVEKTDEECLVYVGKWGDEKRDGHSELWTNIRYKEKHERVNLAIVRINDEQEFLDNVLIKFIETLNELELIENNFYYKIKYGTSDENAIVLIKNGFSISLANLIIEKYLNYLDISIENDTYTFKNDILNEMEKNEENDILIFELKYNMK